MRKFIKSVLIYKRIKKPIQQCPDGEWQSTYAVLVNQTMLLSCHESRTRCGVRIKILLNAPAVVYEIYKAQ